MRLSLSLSLSDSLFFSLNRDCLYFITLFDLLTLSICEFVILCIVNFVCCEFFISLMFCVMLIGSYDSCLLSGGSMGAIWPWGRGVLGLDI